MIAGHTPAAQVTANLTLLLSFRAKSRNLLLFLITTSDEIMGARSGRLTQSRQGVRQHRRTPNFDREFSDSSSQRLFTNTRSDDLQLRSERSRSYVGNYGGQVSAGQLPGAGLSILRGWPAGTIWTTTVLASAAVLLTMLCMSPQPMSVKLWPTV